MTEPKRLCRNCEYFDCEGLNPKFLDTEYRGDCGNPNGAYFTPTADETCQSFFPDSTRWPEYHKNKS